MRPRIEILQMKFSGLISMDFSRCETLRNRDLQRLANSGLKLEELLIRQSLEAPKSKQFITNEVRFMVHTEIPPACAAVSIPQVLEWVMHWTHLL